MSEGKKIDEPLTGWWDKEDTVSGHYVGGDSEAYAADSHPRDKSNRNIFAKESQAKGILYLYFFIFTHTFLLLIKIY
jgi:hypothetical protein